MPDTPYVELHCHSSFSFLDGSSSPLELAERAAELGYPALALTDHDGVWGSMEFATGCKAVGIRPLTGAELTVTLDSRGDPGSRPGGHSFHLTLLVEDRRGYRNLCRLLTEAHANTRDGRDRRARPAALPLQSLAGSTAGLICLSGCAGRGLIPSAWATGDPGRAEILARTLREWFGPENFRIELQRPWWRYDRARNRWLEQLAGRLGVAADRGILSVEGVLIAAMCGTLVGDNICFHIGRHMGRPALDKRPDWKPKVARIERLLARYGAPMMIGFRFLYGLRYVTPFVFGSLGISPWRFLLLDTIGTLLWASTITFVGVYLASALQGALAHIHNVEQALVVLVALGGLIGFSVYR